MNAKDLDLLEKAFSREYDASLKNSPLYMMQTKDTKRADALVAGGLLRKVIETPAGSRTVSGYAITDLGRLTYFMSSRCASIVDIATMVGLARRMVDAQEECARLQTIAVDEAVAAEREWFAAALWERAQRLIESGEEMPPADEALRAAADEILCQGKDG